jgi:uncharacterized protein with NRDE domain
MCTVSYVYASGKVILTSNRDERTERPSSVKPQQYCIQQKKIIFPKDSKAGGTWFAVDEHANVAVLLNGAGQRHEQQPEYLRSRGLVLLDIISAKSPLKHWQQMVLHGIEPFTIVLIEQGKLYQLRWNYINKETISLDERCNYIWSSFTLYTDAVIRQRQSWFDEFVNGRAFLTEEEMQYFHLNTKEGDLQNGLVMNRDEVVKTFSVTQAVVDHNKVNMFHLDLLKNDEYENSFLIL